MIGRIDEVVFDCADPAALAGFWAQVLGGAVTVRTESWAFIDPPGWTRVAFQKVPEAKQGKNRLHIDIEVSELTEATMRALDLGATKVGNIQHDSAGSFQVLLDPEGNEWCVVHAA